jgi:hypothetical protein
MDWRRFRRAAPLTTLPAFRLLVWRVTASREDCGDDAWIELACSCVLDLGDGLIDRPRGL